MNRTTVEVVTQRSTVYHITSHGYKKIDLPAHETLEMIRKALARGAKVSERGCYYIRKDGTEVNERTTTIIEKGCKKPSFLE